MYTLRKQIGNKEHNQFLGNEYSVVKRYTDYDEFQKAFKASFKMNHVADNDENSDEFTKNCYAIIICKGGSETIPLYIGQYNFIMSESGKTFSNLTFK